MSEFDRLIARASNLYVWYELSHQASHRPTDVIIVALRKSEAWPPSGHFTKSFSPASIGTRIQFSAGGSGQEYPSLYAQVGL